MPANQPGRAIVAAIFSVPKFSGRAGGFLIRAHRIAPDTKVAKIEEEIRQKIRAIVGFIFFISQ